MTSYDTVRIPRLFRLGLGMALYTAIGTSIVIGSLTVSIILFLLLLLFCGWRTFPWLIPLVVSLLTGLIQWNNGGVVTALSWFCIVGTIIAGYLIYEKVFLGSDYASLSRIAPKRKKEHISLVGFYVFKVLPELEGRLIKIIKAQTVYGWRNKKLNFWTFPIVALKILLVFFLEAIDVFFSHERVIERRRGGATNAAMQSGSICIALLFIELTVPAVVIIGLVLELP